MAIPPGSLPTLPSVFDVIGGAAGAVTRGVVRGVDWFFNVPTGANAINNREQYDFNYMVFPEDIGTSSQLGHYMMININVPISLSGSPRGGFPYNLAGNGDIYSRVDVLRLGYGMYGRAVPDNVLNGAAFTLPRQTRRIKDSIVLFMPSGGLTYVTENQYEEISLTALGGKLAAGAAALGAGVFAGRGRIGAGAAAGAAAGNFVTGLNKTLATAAKLAGMPINPRIEVLYSHTSLRGFIFQFMMAPKNEKESKLIKDIVTTLRFHAVPELDPKTLGFTYIPPAEFDIKFFHNGTENVNIPRINTCVLTRVEVEYDPTGSFSTFHNGHPVAVRLALNFQEIEPLHKARVSQGF